MIFEQFPANSWYTRWCRSQVATMLKRSWTSWPATGGDPDASDLHETTIGPSRLYYCQFESKTQRIHMNCGHLIQFSIPTHFTTHKKKRGTLLLKQSILIIILEGKQFKRPQLDIVSTVAQDTAEWRTLCASHNMKLLWVVDKKPMPDHQEIANWRIQWNPRPYTVVPWRVQHAISGSGVAIVSISFLHPSSSRRIGFVFAGFLERDPSILNFHILGRDERESVLFGFCPELACKDFFNSKS